MLPLLLLALCQTPVDERLDRAEAELKSLRQQLADSRTEHQRERETDLARWLALLDESRATSESGSSPEKLSWGGYGEFHYNDLEGPGGAQLDIHRFVVYLGYTFSESIQLHSEVELEHGFLQDDKGELSIEQLYVDFNLCPTATLQAGRLLAPLGIVNQRHEPPTFNGVERPSVERVVLPSTWYQDGIGLVGDACPSARYQLMLTNGLDGTGFSAVNGIRGGRQKAQPSANEPAISGRFDLHPLDFFDVEATDQSLRLGCSAYYGGLDNGNKGSDPSVDADLTILSVDAEYSFQRLDLRAVAAVERIGGARELSTVTTDSIASEITGWYVEAAWHWMPETWRDGPRGWHDAIAFVRYDAIDTQRDLPNGLPADPTGDRNEWTLGLGLYPLPNLVLKADYQLRDDEAASAPRNQLNVGLGWSF